MIYYVIQVIVSMVATICFAMLFNAPKKELPLCGISGAIGWVIYIYLNSALGSAVVANLVGTLTLTIFSRMMASIRKNPATVYLISGIFPLVPGAGIYYTSYYLIMNDSNMMSYYAKSTLGAVGAIVLGISIAMLIPQKLFNKLQRKPKKA